RRGLRRRLSSAVGKRRRDDIHPRGPRAVVPCIRLPVHRAVVVRGPVAGPDFVRSGTRGTDRLLPRSAIRNRDRTFSIGSLLGARLAGGPRGAASPPSCALTFFPPFCRC